MGCQNSQAPTWRADDTPHHPVHAHTTDDEAVGPDLVVLAEYGNRIYDGPHRLPHVIRAANRNGESSSVDQPMKSFHQSSTPSLTERQLSQHRTPPQDDSPIGQANTVARDE